MIVIKRKVIIFSLLIISISYITLQSIGIKKNGDVRLVNSEAVEEKIVIIDAGHGR